jgi:hypothetical protein
LVALLKKSFSFVSPYSLKECKKALKSIESQQETMTLLEFVDKTDKSYVRLERRYVYTVQACLREASMVILRRKALNVLATAVVCA